MKLFSRNGTRMKIALALLALALGLVATAATTGDTVGLSEAKTYTITFVDGWGTTLSTQEVEEGKSAVKPENPTHEGYVFTGWDTVEWEYAAADTVVTALWRKDEGGEDPIGHEDDNPGEIVLSPLYQDHMVLQRDQPITVWGKNAAGRTVTVAFADKTATATTGADGYWTATFDSAFAVNATGRTMTVMDDAGHKVTVLDVVVGDVYLATGQSNMDLRLVAVGDYVFTNGTERGNALLRYRRMPRGFSRANPLVFDTLEPTDENRGRNWTLTTDETARNAMSACAYYFGMKLREEVPGVPIGVVVASCGATLITWHMTPEAVAAEKAAGRIYNAEASKCWNAMLNPIRKGSFRGAIWYQGESDGSVGTEDYFRQMQALVKGWRDVWGPDFAFYCVQLHVVTTYKHDDGTIAAPDLAGNACQREAQRRWFMDDTGKKGLAVICATSTVDTHAKDKQFVGERLARFALRDFNGAMENPCGPLFKSATDAGGGRVRVTFEAGTAKGLSAGSRTGESAKKPNQPVVLDSSAAIKGFALSENGKNWVFADTVTVEGETLLVSATGLSAPAYIHYGSWNNPYARGINLYNADKLECSPFAPVQVSGGDTPTHAHVWGDWTTNAAPTCVTDGSMSRTCAAEGCAIGTETKKLDRLGHAWDDWVVTKPVEVGVKGEETRTCSRCELTETHEIAPLPRPEDRHPMANATNGYYMVVEIDGVTNRVEVFTNVAQSIVWTVPSDVTALDYLVVGGGGGGGYQYGGGGGGGGVLTNASPVAVNPGDTLSVTVGAGGVGGASASTPGANGSASAITNGTTEIACAYGGGGGAYLRSAGLAGANGGGGSKGAGGVPTMDGGFAGGGSTGVDGGSGGGGAGGVGGVNNKKTDQTGVCGAGGLGVESAITGAAVRYAGGGGGGGAENGSGATYYAAGGLGTDGGGNGGTRLVEDGVYVTGVAATPGTDGLGGGGGGGAHGSNKAWMVGAKGGDGVVIIRYVTAGGEPVDPPEPEPVVAEEEFLRQEFSVAYSSPEAAASATLPTIDVLPDGYTYAFTLRLDDSSFRSFYAMLGGQIGSTVYDGAIGRALADAGIGASCYHYHNSGGTVNGTEGSDKADPTLDVMSGFQKQVLALSDAFEIGSHTYDHMLLGNAGPNANFFEVMASRALLEAMSQSPVHAEAAAGYSNHATYTPTALVRAGYIFQADGLSVPERGLFGASRMSVEGNNAQPETFWNNCSNVTKRLSPGGCLEGGSHPYLISNPCADLLEDVRMLREDGRFWIVRPTVYASYRLQATLSRIEKVLTDGAQVTYALMRPVPSRVGALTPLSLDLGPDAVSLDGVSVGSDPHAKLAYPASAVLPLQYDAVRNVDNTDGEAMACTRLDGIATRLRIDETANLAVLKLKNTTEGVLSVHGRLRLPPHWTTEAFALDFAVAPGGEKTVSIPLGTVVAETPAEGEVLYADAEMEFVVEGKPSRLHATTFAPSFAGDPEPPTHTHTWGGWVVTKPSEVGVAGEEMRTCAGCGETETRPIDPLPVPGPDPVPGEREATEYGYRMKLTAGEKSEMVCVFTNVTQTWEWTVPSGVTALDYLVVGGGGGGGFQMGGGGGGGGVLYREGASVTSGATLGILVGRGGAGAAAVNATMTAAAENGEASKILTLDVEVPGGGAGGKLDVAGVAGASGGGGGARGKVGGATTYGQFAGGASCSGGAGAGGGGAGGPGLASEGKFNATDGKSFAGAGGAGIVNAITGEAIAYAGGGGGGGVCNSDAAHLYACGGTGTDGGGDGASWTVADGAYVAVPATPGADGRGAGGGGGGHAVNGYYNGAKGGDGVVILRYALAAEPSAKPTVNGETVEPANVFDVANSTKPIVYPSAPTLAGVPGEQTLTFGDATVGVPVYYTATLADKTVSLVLNENAKPRIADGDATEAFELTADGEVKIHLANVHKKLYYALETCAKLGDDWTPGAFEQGQNNFTAKRDPASSAAFYRVVVRD